MKRYLWVVEMLCETKRGKWEWQPTVGVALTRDDAREELSVWRTRNHGSRFRLRRYRAED